MQASITLNLDLSDGYGVSEARQDLKRATAIVNAFAPPPPPQVPARHYLAAGAGPEIARLLQAVKAGHKIKAIKAYRDLTGYGLTESKVFVENNFFNYEGDGPIFPDMNKDSCHMEITPL